MPIRRIFVSIVFFATGLVAADVQSPLWLGLDRGRYDVGFRVLNAYDYSRTWRNRADLPAELARPVRISIWYPTARNAAARMHFRDYVHIPASTAQYRELNERIAAYDVGEHGGGVRGLFNGDESETDHLLGTPVAAVAMAKPASGRFPLVIYSLGQNDSTFENIVLWEYLASHGYVVATVPHLGTSPRRFQLWIYEPTSFDAQVRDLEFAMARVRSMDFVDPGKIAAVGHSMGGTYALMLTMRNQAIGALVGLDASFLTQRASYEYDVSKWPDYDPARVKVASLQLHRKTDSFRDDKLQALRFSDRTLVLLDRYGHGDFNSSPALAVHARDELLNQEDLKVRSSAESRQNFVTVCRSVLHYLDAVFRSGKDDFIPAERATVTRLPGIHGPNEEELFQMMERSGVDTARTELRRLQSEYPGRELLSESATRRIGNELMWGNESRKAIDWFVLDVDAHPDSAAARSRLAAALAAAGEKERAIAEYEHALKIDASNKDAAEGLRKLRE